MCGRLVAKNFPLWMTCLLLQGCVGVMFSGAKTETLKQPTVGEKPSIDSVHGTHRAPETIAALLRERWGEPFSISTASPSSDGEYWTYRFGPVWYGVIPCVVFPIPLVLPLGREKCIFYVRDGNVVSVEIVKCDLVGGVCASLVGPDGGPWAGAGWQRSP